MISKNINIKSLCVCLNYLISASSDVHLPCSGVNETDIWSEASGFHLLWKWKWRCQGSSENGNGEMLFIIIMAAECSVIPPGPWMCTAGLLNDRSVCQIGPFALMVPTAQLWGCHCRCLLKLDVSSNFPFMVVLGMWKFHAGRDLRNHGVQCFCSTRSKYNPKRGGSLLSSKWWLCQRLGQNSGLLSSHQCSFLCSARPFLVNYLVAG